jgi:polyisoprenoid-binding protein YceI
MPRLTQAARRVTAALALGLLVAGPAAEAEPKTLKIDPQHSTVSFSIRHIFTRVTGHFRQFEGSIVFDEDAAAASRVSVTIQAVSIDTNVEARDKDLRSPQFFDVEKYPTLTFVSTGLSEVSGQMGRIRGDLTMHGVTRPVVLDAEFLGKAKDPWGKVRYGFRATTRLDRKDFGLTWNQPLEAGGVLVGDEVEISLEVQAIPAG